MELKCDGVVLRDDPVAGGAEGTSDLPEGVGKGPSGALIGLLWPEEPGQSLSAYGVVVVEDQIGQQRSCFGCAGRSGEWVIRSLDVASTGF